MAKALAESSVVLGAVETKVVAAIDEAGLDWRLAADLLAAQLGRGKADDAALPHRLAPWPAALVARAQQEAFDEGEMVTEDVRHVGVRCTQVNGFLEHFPQRRGTAFRVWQPQRAEAGPPELVEHVIRMRPIAVPRRRASCDKVV